MAREHQRLAHPTGVWYTYQHGSEESVSTGAGRTPSSRGTTSRLGVSVIGVKSVSRLQPPMLHGISVFLVVSQKLIMCFLKPKAERKEQAACTRNKCMSGPYPHGCG